MFNTLDLTWIEAALSPWVTYESQSVFEVLTGKDAVLKYFVGKILTLKAGNRKPRGELAITSQGEPCVAMFQPRGQFDRNWLDTPLANVIFNVNENDLISGIFMISAVPSPASARRSGIFPGIEGPVAGAPKNVIRSAADYKGLRFDFFSDGSKLDEMMRQTAYKTLDEFPEANRFFLSMEDHEATCASGFIGFPSVAVYYQDEVVFRHQGLISSTELINRIKESTQLYVVADNTRP